MQNPFLIGEKVYLRALERADAAVLAPWFNDQEVTRFALQFRPISVGGEEQWIENAHKSHELVLGVALLRLFAPYLPFVTEEVWSWWQSGSIHHAAWPTADEVVQSIGGRDDSALAVREATQAALADVRRIKSMLKKPVKAVIATATLPRKFEGLVPARRDFMAATHIRELQFADVEESRLVFDEEPPTEQHP